MLVRYTNARRIIYRLTACTWAVLLVLLAGDAPWGPYVGGQGYPAARLELVQTFKFDQPDHAALSPDGRKLAVRRSDIVEIWNVGSERLARRIEGMGPTQPRRDTSLYGHSLYGHPTPLRVKWSPDGKLLAVGTADTLIRVVNVLTGQVHRSIIPRAPSPHSVPIAALPIEWSPDGRILKVGALALANPQGSMPMALMRTAYWNLDPRPGEMTFLEQNTNTNTTTAPGVSYDRYQAPLPDAIAWSPNGTSFLSYADPFSLACWDAYSGKATHVMSRSLEVHEKGFDVLANWSANGQTVAHADKGAAYVRLADCKAGQDRGTLPAQVSSGSKPTVRGLAWSPDGRTLATYTVAGLTLWQKNGSIEDFIPEQPHLVSSAYNQQSQVGVTWSPNGQLIATSESFDTSGITKVWDLLFGGPPQMLVTTGAEQMMWSKDSSELHILYDDSVATWRVVRAQ